MTEQYEHEVRTFRPLDEDRIAVWLNEMGEDGWELLAVHGLTYFFKRPIQRTINRGDR